MSFRRLPKIFLPSFLMTACICMLGFQEVRLNVRSMACSKPVCRAFFTIGSARVYAAQTAAAPSEDKSKPTTLIPLPAGAGRDTTKRVCGACHSTNVFAQQHHSHDEWSAVMDQMTSKGMDASDEEAAEVLGYLTVAFPPAPKNGSTNTPADAAPPQ